MTHAITITPVAQHDELYCKFHGQSGPQPAFMSLDCETGALWCAYSPIIGSGMPEGVWNGRTLRWLIPPLTADAANDLMTRLLPELNAILAGNLIEWDGHNWSGTLTDDARELYDLVTDRCEEREGWDGEVVAVWDAADWFDGIGGHDAQRRQMGIDADTTDEEISSRASIEDATAFPAIIEGTDAHLLALRDEAIENRAAE